MKILMIAFFISNIIFSNQNSLFNIDTRIRVVNEKTLYVVVQIDNKTGRRISQLKGFLTELNNKGDIITEQKIIHVNNRDPLLDFNQSSIRALIFPFKKELDHRFRYNISKIVFQNDSREFIWTKNDGLIRIN